MLSPRVRGLTRVFIPSPASRVWGLAPCCHHGFADSPVSLFRHPLRGFGVSLHVVTTGFADSPVSLFRHPLRGFGVSLHVVTTGSRTHPCLYSVTRFAG